MKSRVLDEQWDLALADAGLSAAVCRRYDFDATDTDDGVGAVWFPPGEVLELSEHFPDAGCLEDANGPAHRSMHRIGVWPDTDASVVGARMRHELEHAVQWERLGPGIFRLYDVVHSVLSVKAAGLDGCAGMYINGIPSEQDANAAAAIFLRRHHTDRIDALCQDENSRQLACSLMPPEPVETLAARMVAYTWLFRNCCLGIMEEQEQSFDEALDAACPGAGAYWRRLDAALE
jgi:hypothetical protein